MLVIRGDGRIVVPGDAGDMSVPDQRNDFIRPGGIPDQVSEVIGGIQPAGFHVREHRFQGGQIGMNIGDQREAHWLGVL